MTPAEMATQLGGAKLGSQATQQTGATPSGSVSEMAQQLGGQVLGSTAQTPQTQQPLANNPVSFVGNTLANIPGSVGNVIGGIGSAIMHPIQTVKNIGGILGGAAQEATGGLLGTGQEKNFDALKNFFVQRYGGLDKTLKTIQNDPAGFALDLSSILSGGGATVAKLGEISDISKLSDIGRALSKAGEVTNPIQAGAEAIGGGLSKLTAGRKIAPFGSSFNTEVPAAAERLGINTEIPASITSTSPAVKTIEGLAAKGAFGKSILNKADQFVKDLNSATEDIVKGVGGSSDLTDAGQSVSEGFSKFIKDFQTQKDSLYASINEQAGKIPALTSNTEQALQDILNQKGAVIGGGTGTGFFSKMLKQIQSPESKFTFENLKQTASEIGSKIGNRADPFAVGNKANLEKLWASLNADKDATALAYDPTLKEAIDSANQYFKEGINQINSSYGKAIKRFSRTPDKIVPALFGANVSESDIPRIMAAVGPKASIDIQTSVLQKIFDDARGTSGNLTPGGIARQIKKFGETKLTSIIGPQKVQALKDVDTIAQAIGGAKKITEGSQTGFINRLFEEGGITALNPILGAKILLGDAAVSKFVGSRLGQRLLGSGFEMTGQTGRTIANVGKLVSPTSRALFEAGRLNP